MSHHAFKNKGGNSFRIINPFLCLSLLLIFLWAPVSHSLYRAMIYTAEEDLLQLQALPAGPAITPTDWRQGSGRDGGAVLDIV